MIKEMLRMGFYKMSLNRISLGTFDFNTAAIKCYQKTGFKPEGTLRQSIKAGKSYWNCRIMSILKSEWQKSKSV